MDPITIGAIITGGISLVSGVLAESATPEPSHSGLQSPFATGLAYQEMENEAAETASTIFVTSIVAFSLILIVLIIRKT